MGERGAAGSSLLAGEDVVLRGCELGHNAQGVDRHVAIIAIIADSEFTADDGPFRARQRYGCDPLARPKPGTRASGQDNCSVSTPKNSWYGRARSRSSSSSRPVSANE